MNLATPHSPPTGEPADVTASAGTPDFYRTILVALSVVAVPFATSSAAESVPSSPPPPVSSTSPATQPNPEDRARAEALERLARGEFDDPAAPPPDDALPRNREPRVIYSVPAEYPKELAGTGVSSEVMLTVMVDRTGHASHVRVEDSSDPLFTEAALDAINQWRFLPRIREGRISNATIRITVPVSEEIGNRPVHDYRGGRIALETLKYDEEPDTPIRRFLGLKPVYPLAMLAERKAGEVVVEFVVGDDGRPREFKIIEATHREFAHACQGALVQWRFSAAEKAARPVNTRLRYRMSFQPDELDDALITLARELQAGRTGGLETSRTITQQPRVARSTNPQSYDGTGGAPRRRRVTVELVVTEQGDVRLPLIKSAPDPLSGYMALASVQYWRFEPARKNGVAVPVLVSVPVTF